MLSVLEPVVRAAPAEGSGWDADAAIREAARELSALRPDLYKSQVPLAGTGDEREQRAASAALNDCMTGPWVVLSQGVERDRFEPAVRAACLEGASGFLAGRALWSDVVGREDVREQLRERSAPASALAHRHGRGGRHARGRGTMTLRVGVLHTVPALVPVFHELLIRLRGDLDIVHTADPALLAGAVAAGGVTDEVRRAWRPTSARCGTPAPRPCS